MYMDERKALCNDYLAELQATFPLPLEVELQIEYVEAGNIPRPKNKGALGTFRKTRPWTGLIRVTLGTM